MAQEPQLVRDPITGQEDPSELCDPLQALSQFYRAFNNRDLSLMKQNWDTSDECSMDNPLGGIKRGWSEIRSIYERIFNSNARVRVEFYDYTLHTATDEFFVVGRERGRLSMDGRELNLAIRTTRIFRRFGGRWRQIHHHGSFDDPQILASYQEEIRQSASFPLRATHPFEQEYLAKVEDGVDKINGTPR
jgi:ketosteroid isomerase-like protein